MIRAYAFASGHIGFGRNIPAGATVIARGEADKLKPFIRENARITAAPAPLRGIPDAEWLLVPGMPEALSAIAAAAAFEQWTKWIASKAPREVRVAAAMSNPTRVSMITARAEACLRDVELTATADRRLAGGIYADRQQVLTNIRRIKLKASEAEALLRSLDRVEVAEAS